MRWIPRDPLLLHARLFLASALTTSISVSDDVLVLGVLGAKVAASRRGIGHGYASNDGSSELVRGPPVVVAVEGESHYANTTVHGVQGYLKAHSSALSLGWST